MSILGDLFAAFEALKGPLLVELPPLHITSDGWLEGEGVEIIRSHSSWHYPKLSTTTGDPLAIVVHCSDTLLGSARRMANNRVRQRLRARQPGDRDEDQGKTWDRPASWHASVEVDSIVQMISFEAGAWHAPSLIKGIGSANRTAVGIEFIGKPAGPWPAGQITQGMRLWRALVQTYGIARARAMISHQSLDPTRRTDPGKPFMTQHAESILDYAYATRFATAA